VNTNLKRDWDHDWEWSRLGRTAPKEHRMFWSNAANRLAIADESADLPEHTDDGVLWVDVSRPLKIKNGKWGLVVNVPVVDNNGNQSHTLESVSGAVRLRESVRLRMGVVWSTECDNDCQDVLLLMAQE